MNDPPIAAAEATELEDRKGGFPHSEITGSKGASASPVLIAACHVLHRLSTPRHPSEALQRLIVSQQNSCVVYSTRLERCRGTTPDFCQTMSSSRTEAFKLRGAGYVLPSRFQCLSPSGDGQFLMRSASLCWGAPPLSKRGLRSFAFPRLRDGGARRSRTDDILLAKQALYQLSYGPIPRISRQGRTQESCQRLSHRSSRRW